MLVMQLSQSHEKDFSASVKRPASSDRDAGYGLSNDREETPPHLLEMIVRNAEFQSRSAQGGETNTRRRPPIIITSPQSRDAPSNAPFPRSQQPDADTNTNTIMDTNTNTNTDTDTISDTNTNKGHHFFSKSHIFF